MSSPSFPAQIDICRAYYVLNNVFFIKFERKSLVAHFSRDFSERATRFDFFFCVTENRLSINRLLKGDNRNCAKLPTPRKKNLPILVKSTKCGNLDYLDRYLILQKAVRAVIRLFKVLNI